MKIDIIASLKWYIVYRVIYNNPKRSIARIEIYQNYSLSCVIMIRDTKLNIKTRKYPIRRA